MPSLYHLLKYTTMKVSVVMPLYERADFHANIERIFKSQTYQPLEFLLIEEQWSYDKHKRPIECPGARYILTPDEHTTYINKKILGSQQAKGDLIIIMSSDDYYSPDYIKIWVEFMEPRGYNIARFQGHWVYNIIQRNYGYQDNISGGHSVYMRDWALANYDHNENTLNHIEMPRTNKLKNDMCIIRHTPAGAVGADGWRPTVKLRGRGHTCSKEATYLHDADGSWFCKFVNNPAIVHFYFEYGEKAKVEYPCMS